VTEPPQGQQPHPPHQQTPPAYRPPHQPYGPVQQPYGQGQQPYGPGQQPYPWQPGPQLVANAALKITVQGSVLTSNLVPPTVLIDGHRVPAAIGSTVIPVPAGPHHLEASSQWLTTYGRATLDCQVQPNTTLEVFYAPPYNQFMSGSMGLVPQKRKGLGVTLGVVVGILAVVILIAVLNALVS